MADPQGVFGSYSRVCFMTDEGLVIKYPNGFSEAEKQEWYEHQHREMLFLTLKIKKVNGVVLPKVVSFTPDCFTETLQSGVSLKRENFESLPLKTQKELACRMADFFAKVHSFCKSPIKSKLEIHFFKISLYFKAFQLPAPFLKAYRRHFNALKKTNTVFQKTLCYRDLKASHLLYNKQTGLLSIVDFGAVGFDIPIKEFCLDNPLRADLSLSFLKNTITEYNKIMPRNPVNIDTVKSYLYCAAFNELACVCRLKKIPMQDIIALGQILKSFLEDLDTAFPS